MVASRSVTKALFPGSGRSADFVCTGFLVGGFAASPRPPGKGGGGGFRGTSRGGGVGGEVTVLKYMLLLLPDFQEWISVGSYG